MERLGADREAGCAQRGPDALDHPGVAGGVDTGGGRIQLGGELPVNTDGGGLSSNHPGMRGIFLLIEATKQLRDDFRGTERQVPDCNVAVCHGTGGSLMSGGTIILARDAR